MAETANKIYPFKFLDAYERKDADIFFGREDEIKALYEMVSQNPVVVVYGASGTGKTSLIQCGLAGRFRSYDWLPITIRRNGDINKSLSDALEMAGGNTLPFDEDLHEVDETGMSELSKKVKGVYLNNFKTIYLIFDQFEELYTLGTPTEEETFIAAIKEILTLKQPVKIIFSIREEYLGYLYRFEKSVPWLLRKKIRVEAMTKNDLDEILRGINNCKNLVLGFDENTGEISDAIADKLKGENRTLIIELPYLQVFLENLYLKCTDDKTHTAETKITLESVKAMGDMGDVLKDFLEAQAEEIRQMVLNNKLADGDMPIATIWKILSPFATLDGTKNPLERPEIEKRIYDPAIKTGLVNFCVEEFVKRRILNYAEDTGRYELAHDSLAKCIAGKRTPEEIKLIEVTRLINYQVSIKEGARELFSEKQMKIIKPYLPKLKPTEDEEKLIRDSGIDVKKRRNYRYLAYSGILLAAVFMAGLLYNQNLKNERKIIKSKLKVLQDNSKKARGVGNYLQDYLYTIEALALVKDKKISDSLVAKFSTGSGFYRYSVENVLRDTLPVYFAQFSIDEKKVLSLNLLDETTSKSFTTLSIKREWQINGDTGSLIPPSGEEITPLDSLFNANKKKFLEILGEDENGLPYFLSSGHILNIYGAFFSKDSTKVITWGKNSESIYDAVDFWNIEGINEQIPALVHDGIDGALFSADHSRVLSWGSDSTIRVWKRDSGKAIFDLPADLMKMKSQVETGVRVSETDLTTLQLIPYSEYMVLREKFNNLYKEYQLKQAIRKD